MGTINKRDTSKQAEPPQQPHTFRAPGSAPGHAVPVEPDTNEDATSPDPETTKKGRKAKSAAGANATREKGA